LTHSAIETLYGDDAPAQRDRYSKAIETFRTHYGPGESLVFRAPGRVNLIGEHTDYNHGFVFPVALDRDTLLIARPRHDAVVRLRNVEDVYPAVEFPLDPSLVPARRGDWSNYVRGAAQLLARRAHSLGLGSPLVGLDALVDGATPFGVPRGAGVSSSSALTVVAAVALAHVNGWCPERSDLAQFCAEAEWFVGTRGGVMDHFAAILSQRGHALFLDCRPSTGVRYLTRHVPMPDGYRLMVVDSGVHHDNARGAFNMRVAACRAGVALLRESYPGVTHLRDIQSVAWPVLAPLLPERIAVRELPGAGDGLGDLPGITPETQLDVRARCRHVWTENQRVLDAVAALEAGDVRRVGELLTAAHVSARDDYEVSCPEVEFLVRAALEVDGVAGARLTGAGWGGCIVALTAESSVDGFEQHVRACYRRDCGRDPVIFACSAGPGAGLVSGKI
jgi:galactokinase